MKQLRWLHLPSSVSLFVLSAALATTSANAQPSGRHEPAHWVPVSAAITKTGELRRDMFSRVDLHEIDAIRAKNSTGCTTFIAPSPSEEFIDLTSLDSLIANSLTIARSRVGASEIGFYDGRPGTLYTLRPGSVLRDYGHFGVQSSLFLFIPEAVIPTSEGIICARTFSDVPTPVVGDEVLAFVSLDPRDANHSILQVDANRQLVVVHERQLFHPAAVAVTRDQPKRAFLTLDDLESEVRQNKHINDVPARGAR
jgi:hypothetical protein